MARSIHMTPHVNGYHPRKQHLAMFEVRQHHGMFLLTSPAGPGSLLISWEDWQSLVGNDRQADLEFAYLSDDLLAMLDD
jgi:hypothetical protein